MIFYLNFVVFLIENYIYCISDLLKLSIISLTFCRKLRFLRERGIIIFKVNVRPCDFRIQTTRYASVLINCCSACSTGCPKRTRSTGTLFISQAHTQLSKYIDWRIVQTQLHKIYPLRIESDVAARNSRVFHCGTSVIRYASLKRNL